MVVLERDAQAVVLVRDLFEDGVPEVLKPHSVQYPYFIEVNYLLLLVITRFESLFSMVSQQAY